jgi:hypothetical protein
LQDDVRAESHAAVKGLLELLHIRVPVEVKEAASGQPHGLTVIQARVWHARNQLNELQKTMNLRKREGWVVPQ